MTHTSNPKGVFPLPSTCNPKGVSPLPRTYNPNGCLYGHVHVTLKGCPNWPIYISEVGSRMYRVTSNLFSLLRWWESNYLKHMDKIISNRNTGYINDYTNIKILLLNMITVLQPLSRGFESWCMYLYIKSIPGIPHHPWLASWKII